MPSVFIIKNREREKLGEISYSETGFRVDISSAEEKAKIEDLLKSFSGSGIYNLGEAILSKPIAPADPLFLPEVRNQLARMGYVLIEKK